MVAINKHSDISQSNSFLSLSRFMKDSHATMASNFHFHISREERKAKRVFLHVRDCSSKHKHA